MYFVTSKTTKESLELAKNVISSLKENKMEHAVSRELPFGAKKEIDEINCEVVIAVGDDDFVLKTFRRLGKKQIPLFAITPAQSFLAQANALNFRHYIGLIKKKKYEIFKRARLVARFGSSVSPIGLNDIGLFSSKSASLLKYSLIINDEPFYRDFGDGLVVATPTGSTGYSLSAGGPIIFGEPSIMLLTPVSSLEKHSPVVVSDNAKIKITDIEGNSPVVVVDGEIRIPVNAKEIIIEKSQYSANFVMFSKEYSLESRLKKRTISISMEKLRGLPASSKLIYKVLAHEGNMTQKEIIASSLLPERTARYGLNVLLKKRLVSSQPHFADARKTVYGI